MSASDNLFSTPRRPRSITVHLERLWTEGDDVVGLTVTTRASKSSDPVWVAYQRLQGPAWDLASKGAIEAAVSRFSSSLWDREPRPSTYDQWVELWTT